MTADSQGENLFCMEFPAAPCVLSIFGASGDLTQRKLVPSLAALYNRGLLPKKFYVVGVARTAMSDDAFRERLKKFLPAGNNWDEFLSYFHYLSGDYSSPATYQNLAATLKNLAGPKIFYLSTPPELYETIATGLGQSGLAKENARLVIEKPFGRDVSSAIHLDTCLKNHFQEAQIYRMDHYLGKETVQNIFILRFANTFFEPLWNRHSIERVEITVAEALGVEHRAGYYDKSGALRDMMQNHLLQIFSIIAMEPPSCFEPDAVRDEKIKVLKCTGRLDATALARAQYDGYLQEEGVDSLSRTETFTAMKLFLNNWRWKDVPFYLRTGKKLKERTAQITIVFKRPPQTLFPGLENLIANNRLVFQLQPQETVSLDWVGKRPGPKYCVGPMQMRFGYETEFGAHSADAYERLLLDVMAGDPTHFARADWIESSWQLLEPALKAFAENKVPLERYRPGSWGPESVEGWTQWNS